MSSSALGDLLLGVREVRALRGFPPKHPSRTATSHLREEARIAHRRACVVLLSSHYERYIYALNESVVDFLNGSQILSVEVPIEIRLLQVKTVVDELAKTEWSRRGDRLNDLFSQFSSHWQPSEAISGLQASANLEWMKSPKIGDVKRYFRYFGVEDIVRVVTRNEATRRAMGRQLQSLVDARNGIAHGDQTIQPDPAEISDYLAAVEAFCVRVDKVMAQRLGRLAGSAPPW